MWILQLDKSYLNSNDNTWYIIHNNLKWELYKGNHLMGIFDTLEQAVGAGPS